MQDPTYQTFMDLLREDTRKNFIEILLKHSLIDFKSLYNDYLQISETNARHHLKIFLRNEVVQKVKQKGTKAIFLQLSPRFLERVRRYFKNPQPYLYFGMVGIHDPGNQITQAIKRLISNNWNINTIYVFSSQENVETLETTEQWKTLLIQYPDSQLFSVPRYGFSETYQLMKECIDSQISDHSIIADVTGSTKIHTLVLYSLANEYGLRRVYLPEPQIDEVMDLP